MKPIKSLLKSTYDQKAKMSACMSNHVKLTVKISCLGTTNLIEPKLYIRCI